MKELKYLGPEPNQFMQNKIFKQRIQDINYIPILAVLDTMAPTANIEQVKGEIINWSEIMNNKDRIKEVSI